MHKVFYQWQVFQKNSKNFRNGKMLENHAFAIASLKSSIGIKGIRHLNDFDQFLKPD